MKIFLQLVADEEVKRRRDLRLVRSCMFDSTVLLFKAKGNMVVSGDCLGK
jgi:hypothetical protein